LRAAEPGRTPLSAPGRCFADHPVHQQPPMLLKRPHRVVKLFVEDIERDVLSGAEIRICAVQRPKRGSAKPESR